MEDAAAKVEDFEVPKISPSMIVEGVKKLGKKDTEVVFATWRQEVV